MFTRGLSLFWVALATSIGLAPVATAQAPKTTAKVRPLGKAIRSVAFSADGNLLAAGLGEPEQRGRVVLWDVIKQKQIWSQTEEDGVPAVAFSPDGKTLALGNYDHTAKLRDTQTGRLIKVFAGHTKLVRAVAFSPDGKTLATGSWDQTVKLWDLATGAERLELKWPVERLFVLSFSPTGQWLLAAEEYLRIWDAATGKEQRAQGRAGVYVEWAAFADDHWFLTGDNHGTVRVWSVATGAQRANFGAMAGVRRLAFSPKARRLAVATHFRHDISLYDFTLQAPSAEERERFAALLVKLDDDDYAVREAAGKEVLTLGFIMEPELRRLMKDAPSAEVRIRSRRLRKELLNKPQATLDGHTADVESLAFSPDGRLLASCSMDGTIRLWNVSEHKEVARLTPVVP